MQDSLRNLAAQYFETTANGSSEKKAAQVAWRTACFDQATDLGHYLRQNLGMSLERCQALDLACGWGGHALSLADQGTRVVASDLSDFSFPTLARFAEARKLPVLVNRCSCEALAYASSSFDLIFALELVEHIPHPARLASEIARVLRPGGVALVSTPPRLRSLLFGEPHYGLRGLTLLPFRWQGSVARTFFGRDYPFPIERQYFSATDVLRPYWEAGLEGRPVVVGRMEEWLRRVGALRFGQEFLWNFLVIRRPTKSPDAAGNLPPGR